MARTWDRIFSCRLPIRGRHNATTPDTTAGQPELYNAPASYFQLLCIMHDSFGSLGPYACTKWLQPATRILLYIKQIRIRSLSYHHVPTVNLQARFSSRRPVVRVTTSLTGHVRIYTYIAMEYYYSLRDICGGDT